MINIHRRCKERENIPLQLPKIEQNQLPADCGHPLNEANIPATNESVAEQCCISH